MCATLINRRLNLLSLCTYFFGFYDDTDDFRSAVDNLSILTVLKLLFEYSSESSYYDWSPRSKLNNVLLAVIREKNLEPVNSGSKKPAPKFAHIGTLDGFF